MKELIDKYLSNGLAEFEGLEINGSVPIKQEIINEFIAEFLQKAVGESPAQPPASVDELNPLSSPVEPAPKSSTATTVKSSKLPMKLIMSMVKRAEVQAVEGKLIFHFTVKR